MTTATIEEDKDGNLFIKLPLNMIGKLGWKVGDDIAWGRTFTGLRATRISKVEANDLEIGVRRTPIAFEMHVNDPPSRYALPRALHTGYRRYG